MSALYPEMRWESRIWNPDPPFSMSLNQDHIQNTKLRDPRCCTMCCIQIWGLESNLSKCHRPYLEHVNKIHLIDFWNLANTFKLAYILSGSHPNPTWPSFQRNKSNSGCSQHPEFKTQTTKLKSHWREAKKAQSRREPWNCPIFFKSDPNSKKIKNKL